MLEGALDMCGGKMTAFAAIIHTWFKIIFIYARRGSRYDQIGGIEENGKGVEIMAAIMYSTPYIVNGLFVNFVIRLSNETSANTIYWLSLQSQANFVIDLDLAMVHLAVLRELFTLIFEEPSRSNHWPSEQDTIFSWHSTQMTFVLFHVFIHLHFKLIASINVSHT
jgi:hypothetical protein